MGWPNNLGNWIFCDWQLIKNVTIITGVRSTITNQCKGKTGIGGGLDAGGWFSYQAVHQHTESAGRLDKWVADRVDQAVLLIAHVAQSAVDFKPLESLGGLAL